MAVIGREAARAPLTSADINDGIVTAADLASTLDLSSKTLTLGAVSSTGNLSFGDSDKAIFGAGSDLQIYHNGSNSFVDDAGTGDLYIRSNRVFLGKYTGEVGLSVLADGAVNLNYDNAQKLATTATGIDVTGTVTADGLTVDGSGLIQSSTGGVLTLKSTDTAASTSSVLGQINFYNSDSSGSSPNNAVIIKATGQSGGGNGDLEFKVTNSGIEGSDALTSLRIDDAGDISFYEDTGTTPKFFWDASAESLGIGTTSPAQSIDTTGNILLRTNGSYVAMRNSSGVDAAVLSMTASDITNVGAVFTGSQLALRAGGSEAMRITSAGNVGIGTSSPDRKLHVYSGYPGLKIERDVGTGGAAGLTLTNSTNTGCTITGSDTTMTFRVGDNADTGSGGSEAARIDSSGNLLVGETSSNPYSGLTTAHVFKGSSTTPGAAPFGIYNSSGTASATVLNLLNRDTSTDSTNRFVQFYANVTSTTSQAMGGIVGNGANNVQFATISDAREKTNIQSIGGSLEKINALNPVEFDWIASGEHVNAGFVAQEVEQVFPEFVVENMAGEGQEARKGLTGGMTGGIVAHLVKAIQEQQEIINDLRARVAQLEGA